MRIIHLKIEACPMCRQDPSVEFKDECLYRDGMHAAFAPEITVRCEHCGLTSESLEAWNKLATMLKPEDKE